MKLKKRLFLAAALTVFLIVPQARPLSGDDPPAAGTFDEEPGGCTVIMVGKDASVDGSVTPEIDQRAAELFKRSPAQAVRFLTGYCLNNANSVINAWWKLGDDLLVKYNHLGNYNAQKRTSGRIKIPNAELWQKAVKVIDIVTKEDK